jgi:cytochrome c-type biogenesis protein
MNIAEIWTSISLGLLATVSPCVLPLYPGFLAYISTQSGEDRPHKRYLLGFFVLAGVLFMMLLLGGLIAMLSLSIGEALTVVIPISDLLILTLGVLLIIDRNPFKKLPQMQVPLLKNPYSRAFVYGLMYGPISLPCSGPLLVSIFVVSLNSAEMFSRLGTFLWFGLGFGIPLLALSFLASATARYITRWLAKHAKEINQIGGLLLICIAIYDIFQNLDMFKSILGF